MSLLDKELKRKYKKPKGYKKDARRVKGKTSKQKMPDFIRNLRNTKNTRNSANPKDF